MPRANGAKIAADTKRTSDRARDTLRSAADVVQDVRDRFPELADRAERVFRDQAEVFRSQSKEAAALAGEQLETARTYVIERVQDRPFTTTLAVLGAGFLLGLLFAGRRR